MTVGRLMFGVSVFVSAIFGDNIGSFFLSRVISLLTELTYSRSMEREADYIGYEEGERRGRGGGVDGEWRESGGRVEGEWRESGGRVEGEWRESGGRVEGEWRESGGTVKGQWRESGKTNIIYIYRLLLMQQAKYNIDEAPKYVPHILNVTFLFNIVFIIYIIILY